jgi:hypothetical protein
VGNDYTIPETYKFVVSPDGNGGQLIKGNSGTALSWLNDSLDKVRQRAINDSIAEVESLRSLLFVSKYDGGYDCCGCTTLDSLYSDMIKKLQELLKPGTNGSL